MVRKLSFVLAAAGMAAASVAHAAPLPSRVGAPVANANHQSGEDKTRTIAVFVVLGLIAAIIALTGDSDGPTSP